MKMKIKINSSGRIHIPIKICRKLNLCENDKVCITSQGDRIIIKKQTQDCMFCHSTQALIHINGNTVCPSCMKQLRNVKMINV